MVPNYLLQYNNLLRVGIYQCTSLAFPQWRQLHRGLILRFPLGSCNNSQKSREPFRPDRNIIICQNVVPLSASGLELPQECYLGSSRFGAGSEPIGRYSCTAEMTCSQKGIFLIPLTKRFLFTVGTKLFRGISDPIKTGHRPNKAIHVLI